MSNQSPLVSVLMTAYNREEFIAEAIESVLNSTYQNFELIILDDGSEDNTVRIAKEYEAKDNRIKIYINEKNLGDYANRNKAAGYAKGKYVKYLDSDDAIYDWGLAYCVEIIENFPDAGMGIFKASNKVDKDFFSSKEAINNHFFGNSFLNIGPSGTILNRKAFENIGYFKANYGPASDMYFNIKMASNYPVCILEKEFFYYRMHEGQEINNRYSYLINSYSYLKDAMNLPEIPLDNIQKNKLLVKARRGFLYHCIYYLRKTGALKPTIKAFNHSGIGLKEIFSSILNKPL